LGGAYFITHNTKKTKPLDNPPHPHTPPPSTRSHPRCEFAPSGKPSCATLCKCPNIGGGKGALRDISLQTFDSTRGPLRANFNNMFRHGRRLAGAATEGSLVVTA
jgi:hypothetical protein